MDLSGKLGSFYYSTDDFRSFISHFRDTLRALRLKYEALGEDPLKLFLGEHQHPFPHLNTLELHDAVIPIGPSMKGYTHLTSFLALCPRLKRLVLHETGRLTPIWSPLNPLYFELPQDLPLEELGCDDLSWASHSEALNKVFTEKVIRKLDYYCHSSGLFHELYGAEQRFSSSSDGTECRIHSVLYRRFRSICRGVACSTSFNHYLQVLQYSRSPDKHHWSR
ncbi:hypothetical protein DL96DRAFT_481337 [Flagelloscypha sp. PMI_526]|nr:hypothetical protein DL96DRAFT_481337 [Flagelloscypha sp. PMI_526]